MSEVKKSKVTDEDRKRWALLDELDSSAFSGLPLTEEQYRELVEPYANGTYVQKYLGIVEKEKEKTIKKLELLEQFEEVLKAELVKREQEKSQKTL